MNMKKLFTMMAVSLCGAMAYAQSAISVKDVTLTKGGTGQMEVTIDKPTSNTAFQFDLKLPAKVSVKKADMKGTYGAGRELKFQQVDPSNNIYRFLSYDNENATLTSDGDGVLITLEAGAEAETGKVSLNGGEDQNLVVNPEGTSTKQAGGDVATVTVAEGVSITIGDSKATTFICDKDLDFTDNKDLTAYLVTGIDEDGIWSARISQVPAGTPIYVKGNEAGTFAVATTTLTKTYFKSFLIGNNTDEAISVDPTGSEDKFYFLGTKGFTPFTSARNIGAHKAYIRVAALPAAKAGTDWALSIGEANQTSLCANVDLDFTDQKSVTAYTVIGYENGSLWITPVKRVSAGTPLYIKGPQGDYTIKSAAVQANYANMMVGNNTDEAITIQPTDGLYSNFYVGSKGFTPVTKARTTGAHKAYLQILTSYTAKASVRGFEDIVLNEKVAELSRILFDGDEESATGISRIAAEAGNDAWYNLRGQRISTPTRKGLYIKNGKKVVVK